ncbi:MAG: hypothetical protein Q8K03_06690, partial [Methylotenera sp.]|nr:hypothetical protein [Methylotenera sp.]
VIYKLTCLSEMCLPDTAPPCGLLCRTLSDQLDKLIVAGPDKIIVAQYKSDIFMRTFKHEAWVQQKAKAEAFHAKLEILDRKECKLLMKARLEAISIDVDRYVLFGMDKSSAEEFANQGIKEDLKMCDEFGISPYVKPEPIK